MNYYVTEDGTIDLAEVEAEARRLRAQVIANFFRRVFGGMNAPVAPGAKTV
ncbi:MAG: hypothetical protein HRU32_04290 [Rhodobacteraceae bacterium]|nr:hypothetical protein [Paracoccaceae bacterium]